ncbi:hypothetical protein N0V93_010287 [Gnomoniopsis smithogilvyi]|uniref:Uncharacterized protein n=1 Tax=Gnomoniopsis smithogilvyi TaxID=1191159 RepID=A0A9W8YL08_9PEZI|nr:hypothetical protein N0V93_010287 [Gnomoniopsis smithogilvyi]
METKNAKSKTTSKLLSELGDAYEVGSQEESRSMTFKIPRLSSTRAPMDNTNGTSDTVVRKFSQSQETEPDEQETRGKGKAVERNGLGAFPKDSISILTHGIHVVNLKQDPFRELKEADTNGTSTGSESTVNSREDFTRRYENVGKVTAYQFSRTLWGRDSECIGLSDAADWALVELDEEPMPVNTVLTAWLSSNPNMEKQWTESPTILLCSSA